MKDAARSGTRPALARRASSKNISRKASLVKQPSFNSGGAGGGGMVAGGGASSVMATMHEGALKLYLAPSSDQATTSLCWLILQKLICSKTGTH